MFIVLLPYPNLKNLSVSAAFGICSFNSPSPVLTDTVDVVGPDEFTTYDNSTILKSIQFYGILTPTRRATRGGRFAAHI